LRIRTQCRACGLPYRARIGPTTADLVCPGCSTATPLDPSGWSDADPPRIKICPVCGCRHLYRQRDFNRMLGCGLVAVGALLVPWTYGLSLIALSLLDLWLYRRLAEAVVCYRCDTVYRDARPDGRQGEFDLLKHDVLKYGKSWHDLEKEGDEKRPAEVSSQS
jgi:hypothetical protein